MQTQQRTQQYPVISGRGPETYINAFNQGKVKPGDSIQITYTQGPQTRTSVHTVKERGKLASITTQLPVDVIAKKARWRVV